MLKYTVPLNHQVPLINLRVATHGKRVGYHSWGLHPFADSGQRRLFIARDIAIPSPSPLGDIKYTKDAPKSNAADHVIVVEEMTKTNRFVQCVQHLK